MGQVRFLLNGSELVVDDPDPTLTLLDFLREHRGLRGTKEGCNEGDCGACTVSVAALEDGRLSHRAVNSCILFLAQIGGKSVRTVEGISSPNGRLHPVQRALVDFHGSQCGFCTPGFVMSLYAAHQNGKRDFDDLLAGNLCRCTGYAPIIRAARAVIDEPQPEWLTDEADILQAMKTGDTSLTGAFIPASLYSFADFYAKNPEAAIVAGATEVGLWVNKEFKRPSPMIFTHNIEEMQQIEQRDTGLWIGAGVTITRLREAIGDLYPDFGELLRRYGSEQVRNSATIGGNISNGSPIADSPPALIALGATIMLRRGETRREIALEDFYISYGKQDREAGEFVESLFIPKQPDNLACYKLSRRFDQDISTLCGCFNIKIADGKVDTARIAFGGMAATPLRARAVETALVGQVWNEETVLQACKQFATDYTPISDVRSSADYRLLTAQNLLKRYFHESNNPLDETRITGRGAA